MTYRILVTGSRTWQDEQALTLHLGEAVRDGGGAANVVIVHGRCRRGADEIADLFARNHGIRVERHPAERHPTEDFGPWPGCGPRRNAYMVSLGADVCLAFIRGSSRGATHCADLAEKAGIPVRRYRP